MPQGMVFPWEKRAQGQEIPKKAPKVLPQPPSVSWQGQQLQGHCGSVGHPVPAAQGWAGWMEDV